MTGIPEVQVIGVESVTLEEDGKLAVIKFQTSSGLMTINMPIEAALQLLESAEEVVDDELTIR